MKQDTRKLVEQLSEAIDEMDNGRNLNAKNFIRQVMRALLSSEGK